MKKYSFPAILSTAILCFCFWVMITASFNYEELIVGAIVSIVVAIFSSRFFIHEKPFYLFNPIKIFTLVFYLIFIFLWELIKANVSVAFKALKPGKININPGIVKVPVFLNSEYGLVMLANCITLTPGTITMDTVSQKEQSGKNHYFYIHWLDVKETDPIKAGEIIKGRMEKWLRRVWL